MPFNLLNYAYGAMSVKATTHLFATALYVNLGTLARDPGQILSGEAAASERGYWILGVGIAVMVAASWLIHRSAAIALEKHLSEQETIG